MTTEPKSTRRRAGTVAGVAAALGLGAALTLSPAFEAEAQSRSQVPSPENNATQYNLLLPFQDFINYMGGCCSLADGRGNFEERITGDPEFPYEVKLTHNQYGDELSEPVWIKIAANDVVTQDQAERACEARYEADPENSTCKPPPFNVMWFKSNTETDTGGTDVMTENTNSDGSFRMNQVYCYYPKPDLF